MCIPAQVRHLLESPCFSPMRKVRKSKEKLHFVATLSQTSTLFAYSLQLKTTSSKIIVECPQSTLVDGAGGRLFEKYSAGSRHIVRLMSVRFTSAQQDTDNLLSRDYQTV